MASDTPTISGYPYPTPFQPGIKTVGRKPRTGTVDRMHYALHGKTMKQHDKETRAKVERMKGAMTAGEPVDMNRN